MTATPASTISSTIEKVGVRWQSSDKPYAPAFECGKREGSVAEVERERGIRIIEFDPVLGWYSADPEQLPTALVVWLRS